MRDLGPACAFAQREAAQALFFQELAARRYQRLALEAYERERKPVARQVLRATDFAWRQALLRENAAVAFARAHVFPRVIGSRAVQRRVIEAVSEVRVARREIARYF